ncbi:MAG: hypothetical protein HY078_05500 [Elusimicrobia bacterium]|nr:hypothetical protein [Elusimicrobiota bacterium]
MNGWSARHYGIFRAALGAYAAWQLASFIPWGAELFSREGLLPMRSRLTWMLPNPLGVWDSPAAVTLFLALGVLLAVLFTAGIRDRAAGIGLWFVWACLVGRNPLIGNPSLPYVSWLFAMHALQPPIGAKKWSFSKDVLLATWILMSVAYAFSGYTKLVSPSWQDGAVMRIALLRAFARPAPPAWLQAGATLVLLKLVCWTVIASQLAFAPLALSRALRPWAWLSMLLMHVLIAPLLGLADLSAAMVLFHIFSFDPGWIPASIKVKRDWRFLAQDDTPPSVAKG